LIKRYGAFFMAKFTNPLDNISVASPCSQDWNAMMGSEQKRYCGECKLNVYNLSGMSRNEAENLILNSEGRLCVRFYKRADGTILTKDCPVGWRAVKRRISRTATAAFSLIIGLLGGLGFTSAVSGTKKTGLLSVLTTPTPPVMMGDVAEDPRNIIMGGISPATDPTPNVTPKPKATPKVREYTVGEMVLPKG
jgi:hypothetical protein